MRAPLSRRNALRGSVVASLGLVAGVAAAQARPASSLSADATALRAEFDRMSAEYRTACHVVDEVADLIAYPDVPEEIFARPGDFHRLRCCVQDKRFEDGRAWYGEPENIERLRGGAFRFLSGRIDEEGASRRDEIVGAWDRWKAAKKAAEDACGYTAADVRFTAAADAYEEFRQRLVDLRTIDPGIMALKAMVVRDLVRGHDGLLSQRIEQVIDNQHGPEEGALSLSLTRDFMALLGAAQQEVDHV